MVLQPNSTINLYGNVEISAGYQIAFSTFQKQTAYFETKLKASMVNCTIIKKTGALRVSVQSSIIKDCNYLSFVNPNWDDKVIYARIIDYNYINNETTEIAYQIDYFQSFMFDVEYEDMYIDREHLSKEEHDKAETNPYDPSIFQFRTPEPLAVGKDFEKLFYNVSNVSDEEADGVHLFDSLSESGHGEYGTALYLSYIDLKGLSEELGSDETTPEDWFTQFETKLIETKSGLSIRNGVYKRGTGWESGTIKTSKFKTPYWFFFIPNYMPDNYKIDDFINKLTTWNVVSSILNIYYIPVSAMQLALDTENPYFEGHIYEAKTSKDKLENVYSKKLMNYPYSYMRLITPSDTKELRYEKFHENQIGENKCSIGVTADVTEIPTMIAYPVNYEISGLENQGGNDSGANILESVVYNKFPTAPYNIDAWLTQMASNAASIIANNTQDYAYQLDSMDFSQVASWKQNAFGVLGTGATVAGNVLEGKWVSAGVNLIGGSAQSTIDYELNRVNTQRLINQEQMSVDAYRALAGDSAGNAVFENYKNTRAAYAADKYVRPSGDGILNYNSKSFIDIVLLHVQLNESILQQYDRWFKNYGYTSGRCGIPHVVSFMRNSQNEAELPEWVTIDGKQESYVKTNDCHVVSSMLPVSTNIEALFNAGCRFANGDSLIGGNE